jgi:four helix bundle protein
MNERLFKQRTKVLALQTIALVESLPRSRTTDVVGKQLLRSITSVGANYRAACRAKSGADMVSKLAIVEEEADESLYWMEILVETNLVPATTLQPLMQETNEIVAMTVASIKKLRQHLSPR